MSSVLGNDTKLKILQISHRVPWPLNEGGTIGIYNYTRGFAEAGHDVTLLTLDAKKHQIDEQETRTELEKYCRLIMHPINTDVRALDALKNLFTKESYNVSRFYDPVFEQKIVELLQKETFDLIQVEGTFAAPYTEAVMKHRSGKVILRQHNVEYQIWERLASNTSNPLKKWYLNLLSNRLKQFEANHLNQYDAIVPVTEDDGQLFRELGCTKPIYASPSGIDTERWKPNHEVDVSSIKKLYHIGSLEWMPNLEAVEWFVREIWPSLREVDPKLEFYVAGKGMPAEMKSNSIEGVHYDGEVPDAVEYIADKGICVVPLLSGSGIRLKILEAMSAGKPVISTKIGAQGIKYKKDENILIADTKEQFIEAVTTATSDVVEYSKYSTAGRDLIMDRYSNKGVIKHLIQFISTL